MTHGGDHVQLLAHVHRRVALAQTPELQHARQPEEQARQRVDR